MQGSLECTLAKEESGVCESLFDKLGLPSTASDHDERLCSPSLKCIPLQLCKTSCFDIRNLLVAPNIGGLCP